MLLLLSGAQTARAQGDEHKFEAGGHFTTIRFSRWVINEDPRIICVNFPCGARGKESDFEPGLGGRFGYHFNKYVAAEAEVNFFPDDERVGGGRKAQGLFGVKAGRRFQRMGVFAKARPGFLHASAGNLKPREDTGCILIFPPPEGCFEPDSTTEFALDVGGVFEIYPTSRAIIRIDAGDTIIRHGERNVIAVLNPAPGSPFSARRGVIRVAAETTHNFQGSVGVGFRF